MALFIAKNFSGIVCYYKEPEMVWQENWRVESI